MPFTLINPTTINGGTAGSGTVTSVTAGVNLTDSGTPTDPIIDLDPVILMIDQQASPPAASAAQRLNLYARDYAERCMPEFRGELGAATTLQPALFSKSVEIWRPSTTTTAAIQDGQVWTVSATQAHPSPASTNILTSQNRATFTTTTGAGNIAGVRGGRNNRWRGNAAGLGGFFAHWRFAVGIFQSACQIQITLNPSAALAGEPSAVNNMIGIVKDQADTNYFIASRDATTTTRVDTGVAVAINNTYDVFLYAAPNASEVIVRMVNVGTGTVAVDDVTVTATLPVSTTFLSQHAHIRTNDGATAVELDLMKMYCESDI